MRVTYQFLAPVHVEVEDGRVMSVTVIDTEPVTNPTFVDGNRDYFESAVAASLAEPEWPPWELGY